MKRIVVNGANGYVASNFVLELLKQGYRVTALVRGNSKFSAQDRLIRTLEEMADGAQPEGLGNLEVYDYSLFDENFGLGEDELKAIFSGKIDYFHFAASLKFDFKSKDEIFDTNLKGVRNSSEIFLKYADRVSRFFFISTAYSCGRIQETFYERFYPNEDIEAFRNYYEQSKRYAENIVREYMEKQGLNASILRLSQVVGNNITGVTKTDYGIFDFSKRIRNLAMRNPGSTVRFKLQPDATQNLIPINTVVDYLMTVVENEELPQILHLVSKQGVKNVDILRTLESLLPIKLVPVAELKREEMTAMERILDVGMSFTGAYMDTNLHFSTENIDRITNRKEKEMTAEDMHRMVEYFLKRQQPLKKSLKTVPQV